ncbi:hypothetical protein [Tunicatimonas pelagia]|uniref:hypothetical protein n=1 Tax=Tunicatimonas pelagia TaxID=931531 RepID=UPI002665C085|nr:hypothetical protein [Tunicatimonas pelagia]WKN42753.1 hypothetical protein P0M28_27325 [Tunicatimonas pelagia]
MTKSVFPLSIILGLSTYFFTSCDEDDDVTDNSDPNDTGSINTPLSAFDEFNSDAVTISFDGDEIIIESNGRPNHTTPYWEESDSLYIEPVVAIAQTPGRIGSFRDRSFTLTASAAPEIASSSSATGLGPIGISVTGVPIFNDTEGPNRPIEEEIAETFDYAGGHVGPLRLSLPFRVFGCS